MAEGVRERVKAVREALGISQRDFAGRVFISQTLLGDIELGNRNITQRTVRLISTEFGVNGDRLLSGEGDMFVSPPPDLRLEKLVDIYKQLDKVLKDFLLDQSKALLGIQKEKLDEKTAE
jgi:transcriptional regulator with XRE-family HTH domain